MGVAHNIILQRRVIIIRHLSWQVLTKFKHFVRYFNTCEISQNWYKFAMQLKGKSKDFQVLRESTWKVIEIHDNITPFDGNEILSIT